MGQMRPGAAATPVLHRYSPVLHQTTAEQSAGAGVPFRPVVRPASGICRFRMETFDYSVIKNQVGFLSATTAPRFPIGLSGPTVESLRVWRSSSPFNSAPMQTT